MTAFLARVLRRLYLEPLPVVFLDVSFSITYLDALSNWNAGLMHVNSNDLPIFDHQGRIVAWRNVETALIFLLLRHRKFLMKCRAQLIQGHTDFHIPNTI